MILSFSALKHTHSSVQHKTGGHSSYINNLVKSGMGAHLFLNTPNSLLLGSSTTILSALNEWLILCCVNKTLEWIFGGPKTPPCTSLKPVYVSRCSVHFTRMAM